MIPNLLPYKTDIYHLTAQAVTKQYGLPSDNTLNYPNVPDLTNVSCYYYSLESITEQTNPAQKITQRYKMIFEVSEDIRENDLVIINDEKFQLWKPDKKLSSHIEVVAMRLKQ